MVGKARWIAWGIIALGWTARPHAAEVEVPAPLEAWRGWVLQGQEFRKCPFLNSSGAGHASNFICAWPERLTLDLNASGGSFAQRWRLFSAAWVQLPGNLEHWPLQVRIDGAAAPVVARDGVPQLWLAAGNHALSGEFRWDERPEALAVPASAGIVNLSLDGKTVSQAERVAGGVWLGKRRTAEQPAQMTLQVYRLIEDEIPVRLITRIRLQVAGDAREEVLAASLPEGFIPLTLNSELPARLEADGRLRVQVRPGQWQIVMTARGIGVAGSVKSPAGEGVHADEEIWSFAGNDRLRIVAVEGAPGIDPVQAGVPEDWRSFPSYRLERGAVLQVVERSRGVSTADDNELKLNRQLWLDFSRQGFTAVDTLSGRMQSGWRLDMAAPYRLSSAETRGDNLLVTQGADPKLTGIEVRSPNLALTAVSRIDSGHAMPALGWQTRFSAVNGVLNLPPGHRLVAAFGADDAPGAWLKRWRLLDMFLVLIVSVAAGRLLGWPLGIVALVALGLTRHDAGVQIWLWANLLVASVLYREAPEGRLKHSASIYRYLSIAAVVFALLPFVAQQVRLAIYPQLEAGAVEFSNAQESIVTAQKRAAAPAEPLETPPPLEVKTIDMASEEEPAEVEEDQVAQGSAPAPEGTPARKDYYPLSTRLGKFAGGGSPTLQRYAPGTLVQTGPGVPAWRYNSYAYSWSGPVDATQKLRFVILTPFWLGVWRILGCVLLAYLFFSIIRLSMGWPRRWPTVHWPASSGSRATKSPAVVMLIGSGLLSGFFLTQLCPTAVAADIPEATMLSELKTRLTKAPDCVPACAEITAARVTASGERVEVVLDVSALATVALPVPAAPGRWEPDSITIDGQTSAGLYRDPQNTLWVSLRPGAHNLRLSGRITAAASVQLAFPQAPRSISALGNGWEFSGIADGKLLTGTLELVRQQAAAAGAGDSGLETSLQFAPFVRVTRLINFDLDWTVTTLVERLAPDKGAFTLEVPLLPGESVLSDGLELRNGRTVLVAMAAGETHFRWTSALAKSDAMELSLSDAAARTEIWSFAASPQWNVRFQGTPEILPADVNLPLWRYEYHPRAGEKLQVQISRPATAKGPTLAIDRAVLDIHYGRRVADATLDLSYRSTQGGRHVLRLPDAVRVTAVLADGQSLALRPEKNELAVGLLPGKHSLRVQWQAGRGAALHTRIPAVNLGSPASNLTTRMHLSRDRWVLFAFGPGVGPAILFWGELLVFVVFAVLIGRSAYSPLKRHEWLLLGLGLSTFSWSVLVVFAAWIFLMRWRESWDTKDYSVGRRRFNLRQLALGGLSIVAIASLIAAIPHGLLSSPDMRISSPEFAAGVFAWFTDQTAGSLPRPAVISVSLWWYKAAMLAWALWLSFALLKWLPWAWRAYTKEGLWRGKMAGAVPPVASAAAHPINPG